MVGLLVGCCFVGWLGGWLVAGWLAGQYFRFSRLHFTILRLAFCTLCHHVVDLGVHWDTKGDSLGSRVGFPPIFSGFWEPVGRRFLLVCLFFLGTRLSILSVSSEVCFLVGSG